MQWLLLHLWMSGTACSFFGSCKRTAIETLIQPRRQDVFTGQQWYFQQPNKTHKNYCSASGPVQECPAEVIAKDLRIAVSFAFARLEWLRFDRYCEHLRKISKRKLDYLLEHIECNQNQQALPSAVLHQSGKLTRAFFICWLSQLWLRLLEIFEFAGTAVHTFLEQSIPVA